MVKVTLNDLIARCNIVLHKFLWPDGGLEHASQQHRDCVRIFMAGAMETLLALNERETVHSLMDAYAELADAAWLPDERFRSTY